MRWITLFVLIAGLVLAAACIGVWAASRTTDHANLDTRGEPPVGGRIQMPPVF
jgi:hypothetical protein